jgi:hypothetical protein
MDAEKVRSGDVGQQASRINKAGCAAACWAAVVLHVQDGRKEGVWQ